MPQATLLVVDDEPANIEALAAVLDPHYELRFAMSGLEALTAMHDGPLPDLVLLDVMLPDIDGFEVCTRIRADARTAGVPVIFITALGQPAQEELGFGVGAVDYIAKPFTAASVRARVRNHLELKRNRELLQRLAITDALTGLANRRHFDEALRLEVQRHRRQGLSLGLALIDIDHFKRYNDHYGHPKGDECLNLVSAALAGSLRRASDLIARVGGEEFAILMPETDLEGALSVAERGRAAVSELAIPHAMSTTQPFITVSIGLHAGIDIDDAQRYRAADQQLYRAKAAGRDQIMWDGKGNAAGGGK
jgi:diguanylate cyclase (GGDEF)-like protein